jgi:hypothetical protein
LPTAASPTSPHSASATTSKDNHSYGWNARIDEAHRVSRYFPWSTSIQRKASLKAHKK